MNQILIEHLDPEGMVAVITPSVTVAVARQDKIIWKGGGWANSE
jgi:hypothetical protein